MAAAPAQSLFQEVTSEKAYEIAAELKNQQVKETDSVKVYSGEHPEHGSIYVVIPPLGNPLLLPLVVQQLKI